MVIEDDPLPNLTLIEYLESKDIKYIPELYRQKLMSLVDNEDWPEVLNMGISEIAEILSYRRLVLLRMCDQENLRVLDDLEFFIGLICFIPNPVGGYPPGMVREA